MLDRRGFIQGIAAASGCLAARPAFATSRTTLGDMTIHSVSDGNLMLPGAFFFDGLPEAEVAEILARHNVPSDMLTPPCNVTVLQHGDKTVLFDAGSGGAFMPSAGTLLDSLDAIDLTPDDITHVIFTHAHPDHLWGVLDDFDDPMFPDAAHLIGEVELDYWRNPNTVNEIGEERASFAVGAARRLAAIDDVLATFKAGDEVLSGVMAHASYGHTPGHISFELRSGTDALMVVGDAIGNHHVAVERPEWASGSDQDGATGSATRQRLLDQLATDKMAMLGFHLPDGGIGRIERKGDAYRFVSGDL